MIKECISMSLLGLFLIVCFIPEKRWLATWYVLNGRSVVFNTHITATGQIHLQGTEKILFQDNEWHLEKWLTVNGREVLGIENGRLVLGGKNP